MTVRPRSGELSLLIIAPLITGYHYLQYGVTLMLLWTACAWVLAWSMHLGRSLVLRQRSKLSGSINPRWPWPRIDAFLSRN